ncbi:multicopper oxidase family protein [Mycobacterium haemophilum]|uniref:Oxidase n=1 Tax=Mycobacterium haemophilum TaxID=29311 RepID=A0A0I9VHR3_9MYCO|nr:multicopper oxidase family protein [Mycobacterium haemophilum]KLO29917.1 oxidase [Mycobacterium haemophilum]KLO38499.1 oxidase [Mycobacterium haemophilum]KLO44833.1 oxidase [Mycobacterium haemophilum]KLO56176.1 oxidase [Mycobacterium haemophilum]
MPVLPTSEMPFDGARLTRRGFIAAGIAGGFTLAACSQATTRTPQSAAAAGMADAIAAAEAARPHSGHTVTATLVPQQAEIDLGGVTARTLAYGNTIPGPVIRANIGDELAITVTNRLDHPTSVHWHGVALRNDMDGAEPATPSIPAGRNFTYRFSVPNAGTYWAHPHTGLDADMGLYLPVIIDDPTEPGHYDAEWIVVMDDWTDGVGKSPQQLYDDLTSPNKPSMPEMPGGDVGKSDLLGGDAGDITYPYYLINGRIPAAATTFKAKPGQRIRIRFINTGSDTAFRVALAGHSMTVTHTDGYPVVPTQVDALLIGMAERYDVIVTAADGVFPLVASAEGKNAVARALLVTGSGGIPDPQFRPAELTKRIGTIEMFTAATAINLGPAQPNLNLAVVLGGNMMRYNWTINGEPLQVQPDQRPTLKFHNTTMMWHPMHLHGHTFQVIRADGRPGARKDTLIVLPNQKIDAVLVADNPGTWMFHCHNTYHQEAGMQTLLNYTFS